MLSVLIPIPQVKISDTTLAFLPLRPGTFGFLLFILSHNLVVGFVLFLLGFSLIAQVIVLFIDGVIDGLLVNNAVHQNPAVLLYLLPHGSFEIVGLSLLAYSGYLMFSMNARSKFALKYLMLGFVLIIIAAYIESYVSVGLTNWILHNALLS